MTTNTYVPPGAYIGGIVADDSRTELRDAHEFLNELKVPRYMTLKGRLGCLAVNPPEATPRPRGVIRAPAQEADLVCEALVREIGRAGRWSAIVEAWEALLTVRHMQRQREREDAHLAGGSCARACP